MGSTELTPSCRLSYLTLQGISCISFNKFLIFSSACLVVILIPRPDFGSFSRRSLPSRKLSYTKLYYLIICLGFHYKLISTSSWPRGNKTPSMKFVLLINLRLITISNSFLLNKAQHEIFSANKYENAN